MTSTQLPVDSYQQIGIEFLRDLHDMSIHNFNHAKDDFPLGFWNGYGCAIKAIIEKLKPLT